MYTSEHSFRNFRHTFCIHAAVFIVVMRVDCASLHVLTIINIAGLVLIFSVIICILLIVRTVLEDTTLKKELPGYADYTENVRYKLIPFLW